MDEKLITEIKNKLDIIIIEFELGDEWEGLELIKDLRESLEDITL